MEVRVLRYPRLGRRVPMLEIELNEPEDRLIILSRWDLGTEPDQVADILWSVGFTRRKY
ncbi:PH domain-containing protein [Hoyosella rhizosphaerae]|uniref:PH domain-containing protein n=1 Tax=Hoyosella rhizosphaerae TaxID=1755582 RepID=UPI001E509755|nr:PH domain-containing protein [Hoyosella rhizosphaerae]